MIILYLYLAHLINKSVKRRWDGSPIYPYWRASDFGIEEERFSFLSSKRRLYGSRYFLKGQDRKGLVVFFHGIGDGRISYVKEICAIAKQGYLVYAFDYTGCMESEGKTIIGLGQPLKDEEAFFRFLDEDKQSLGLKRYVVGHSWGGYVALSSKRGDFKVSKIVSISGFIRPSLQFYSMSGKRKNAIILWLIRVYTFLHLGKYGDYDPRKDLRNKEVEVLYIQGEKDNMVPVEFSGRKLYSEFHENTKFTFLFVPDAKHNSYMSPSSENYLEELHKKGINSLNRPVGLTMDLRKATEENPQVMKAIFDFLAK